MKLILIAAVVLLASCQSNQTKYPFRADESTLAMWQLNYKKIGVGMTKQEVIELMGTPYPLQHKGFPRLTFFYLISKQKESDGFNDKQTQSISISFDSRSKVISKSQHYLSKEGFNFSNKPRFDLNK